jgi:hypothetical protein
MKLATAKQIEELRAASVKRRDYDELGPALYDCWLLGLARYVESRYKRQAASVKLPADRESETVPSQTK